MTTDTVTTEGSNELIGALSDDLAFRRWYERTLPRVYGYVASRTAGDLALAEEVTQQVFVAAIDQRARFDGRSDSVTWLCAIARHKLVDHFRRLEREERRHRQVVVQQLRMETEAETGRWAVTEHRELIAAALGSLPAPQRVVLTLVALDDLTVAEVARLVGKSIGATQSLLARARDGFRRAYDAEAPNV